MTPCRIAECDRQAAAKELCKAHYQRLWKYGDPLRGGSLQPRGLSLEERFLSHVDKTDLEGCWRWTGKISTRGRGYGDFSYRDGGRIVTVPAHRFAYELWVGPIPQGMQIDHVLQRGCIHTDCVRAPDHLEPVSPAENTRRYLMSLTHCRRGHAYAEWGFQGTTGMRCRKCERMKNRAFYASTRPDYTPRDPDRTHCANGHELTPENILIQKGGRKCRQCGRDRQRTWRERKKQQTQPPSD